MPKATTGGSSNGPGPAAPEPVAEPEPAEAPDLEPEAPKARVPSRTAQKEPVAE